MSVSSVILTKNLCAMRKQCLVALLPVQYNKSMGIVNVENFTDVTLQNESRRAIHTTNVRHDLTDGLKGLGAGFAAMGTIGPGLGVGLVFHAFISGVARNPSSAKANTLNAFMGAAFCEALGLMAIMLGFINAFS